MKTSDFLIEGLGEEAEAMHVDHEVQVARDACYHTATTAIELYKVLGENPGQPVDGWIVDKLAVTVESLAAILEHLTFVPSYVDPLDQVSLPAPDFDASFDDLMLDENEELYKTMSPEEQVRDIGKRMIEVNRIYTDAKAHNDRLSMMASQKKLAQLAQQKQKLMAEIEAKKSAAVNPNATSRVFPNPRLAEARRKPVGDRLAREVNQIEKRKTDKPEEDRKKAADKKDNKKEVEEGRDYRSGVVSKAQMRGWEKTMTGSRKAQSIVKIPNPYDINSQPEEYADFKQGARGARRKMSRLKFFDKVVDERASDTNFGTDSDMRVAANAGSAKPAQRPAPRPINPKADPNDLNFTEGRRLGKKKVTENFDTDLTAMDKVIDSLHDLHMQHPRKGYDVTLRRLQNERDELTNKLGPNLTQHTDEFGKFKARKFFRSIGEDATGGGTCAGSVAAVAQPLMTTPKKKKKIIRRTGK